MCTPNIYKPLNFEDPTILAAKPGPHIPRDKLCWNGATYIVSLEAEHKHQCCCSAGKRPSLLMMYLQKNMAFEILIFITTQVEIMEMEINI